MPRTPVLAGSRTHDRCAINGLGLRPGTAPVRLSRLAAQPGYLRGLAAMLVLGGLFGLRSPDPAAADPPATAALHAQLEGQTAAARDELEDLRRAIKAAIDQARTGAALTITGTKEPGAYFAAAGSRMAAAEAALARAHRAVARVAGSLAIASPASAADGPNLLLRAGQLAATGAQLTTVGAAADAFVSMRRATEATLVQLAAALATLTAGDATAALVALDAADTQLASVRAWPGQLQTLSIWADTTEQLLSALRALAKATIAHDVTAARAAERAYQRAADDGHRADQALAIALAEGGSAISSGAMRSAADALAETEKTLAELAAIP
jgi:hypothetical protein